MVWLPFPVMGDDIYGTSKRSAAEINAFSSSFSHEGMEWPLWEDEICWHTHTNNQWMLGWINPTEWEKDHDNGDDDDDDSDADDKFSCYASFLSWLQWYVL